MRLLWSVTFALLVVQTTSWGLYGPVAALIDKDTAAIQRTLDVIRSQISEAHTLASNAKQEVANLESKTAVINAEKLKFENTPVLDAQSQSRNAAELSRSSDIVAGKVRAKNTATLARDQAASSESQTQQELKVQAFNIVNLKRTLQQAEAAQLAARQRAEANKLAWSSSAVALKAKIAAANVQLEAAKAAATKTANDLAADITRARAALVTSEGQTKAADANTVDANEKARASEQRMVEKRKSNANARRAFLLEAQTTVAKERVVRDTAKKSLAEKMQEADARERTAGYWKASSDRSAEQLRVLLQEHAKVLLGLSATLKGLAMRQRKTQLDTASGRITRSAQLTGRRQSALLPLQERAVLFVAQGKQAAGQRAAAIAAAQTELQYAGASLGRKRNETDEQIAYSISERNSLNAALNVARASLIAWRMEAMTLTDRQDNETSRRVGETRALKESAAGAAERLMNAEALQTQQQRSVLGATEAVVSRRDSLQRSSQAGKIQTARQLQLQAVGNEEARVARERIRRDTERAAIEQTSALFSQSQVLSGEVEGLLTRRRGLQAELALVQQERARTLSELAKVDEAWATIGTSITRLRLHRGELEVASITAAAAVESAQTAVKSKERVLGIAGEEQRRLDGGVKQAEALKATAQAGFDQAQKALKSAGQGSARFEKMRAVQATVTQLSDAIGQAGARLRAAEAKRSALQREIAEATDRRAVLAADAAEVDARLQARREQASVSKGTDAELKARLAELSASLHRLATESAVRVQAGRVSLQAVAKDKAVALAALDEKLRPVLQAKAALEAQLEARSAAQQQLQLQQRQAAAAALANGMNVSTPTAPGPPPPTGTQPQTPVNSDNTAVAAAVATGPSNAALLVKIAELQATVASLVKKVDEQRRSPATPPPPLAPPQPPPPAAPPLTPVSTVHLRIGSNARARVDVGGGRGPHSAPEQPLTYIPSTSGMSSLQQPQSQPMMRVVSASASKTSERPSASAPPPVVGELAGSLLLSS